jgi:hypothetical protein
LTSLAIGAAKASGRVGRRDGSLNEYKTALQKHLTRGQIR